MKLVPPPLPDVLCAACELPYRHHDDFERCLFVPQEQYFREMTSAEWQSYSRRHWRELFSKERAHA
jgi:hypothetical protein